MKVQLSQIEDFESAPSRIKIQWKEVEMVIDDYKYIIEMFINHLNKINDETKFE